VDKNVGRRRGGTKLRDNATPNGLLLVCQREMDNEGPDRLADGLGEKTSYEPSRGHASSERTYPGWLQQFGLGGHQRKKAGEKGEDKLSGNPTKKLDQKG